MSDDTRHLQVETDDAAVDRPYRCTSCDTLVHARWSGDGSFSVGCDCTTVPVVPQMGQAETPDNWRVARPECCRDVSVSELETVYGQRGVDYECPECGAAYSWDGTMATAPQPQTDADADADDLP